MSLTPGTRLGPYEISAQIGKGGMGEVYRALDTNLRRQVAIKVLPQSFAGDGERLARFQREAEVLATLNHPNIAAIYGLEKSDGHTALVMELVEGLTLADRIDRGPVPLDDALAIARQIAEALDAAHQHGIVHRDLKPANIKVRDDGTVKVLDFGLAKAMDGPEGGRYAPDGRSVRLQPDLTQSPTITTPAMTQAGVILGTAAYMSPEQAKGKPVDRRTDVWAFGCVLYEMLTGTRLFEGETVTDTLAAVLTREPDWNRVPARVRPLLRRCLEKDPRSRTRDIAEAMAWTDSVTEAATSRPRRPWIWPLVAASAVVAALALAFLQLNAPAQVSPEPVRFEMSAPANITPQPGSRFAISPDGRSFALLGAGPDGVDRVWVRAMDRLDTRPLPGTEVLSPSAVLTWSPDSRQIAFVSQNKLRKVQLSGGPPVTLCDIDVRHIPVGATWNRDDIIVFGTSNGGVFRASATGGSCSPLTKLAESEIQHLYPQFLPDGRHFLYVANSVDRKTHKESGALYVGSLDIGAENQPRNAIVETGYKSAFIPARDGGDAGTLLFVRDRTLMSQGFDPTRLALVGDPVPVAEPIGTLFADAAFSASSNTLVYRTNAIERYQLTWFEADGRRGEAVGEPAFLQNVALSRDGKRAAYNDLVTSALWVVDVERGTRTAILGGSAGSPVWSPDGERVMFSAPGDKGFAILHKSASGVGNAEVMVQAPGIPEDWSRDGSLILYRTFANPGDLWALSLTAERKPFPVAQTSANEADGRISPDGRLLAYSSNESGSFEVYVRVLARPAGDRSVESANRVTVSRGGGNRMFAWRADGKELWYQTMDKKIMAVEVATAPALRAGEPKLLFQVPDVFASVGEGMSAASDGRRFLMAMPVEGAARSPFVFVLNWQQGLGRRAP